MKNTYLTLAIIGFILPNILVTKVSIETGNILLYTNPVETFQQMFANDIAATFMIDLFFVVFLFLFWSYREAQKVNLPMKKVWITWGCTFAFGLAGGLPLFFYFREKHNQD